MQSTDTLPEVAPSVRNERADAIHRIRRETIQSAQQTDAKAFNKWLKQHLTEIKLGA